jgi:hypothetical protein
MSDVRTMPILLGVMGRKQDKADEDTLKDESHHLTIIYSD